MRAEEENAVADGGLAFDPPSMTQTLASQRFRLRARVIVAPQGVPGRLGRGLPMAWFKIMSRERRKR